MSGTAVDKVAVATLAGAILQKHAGAVTSKAITDAVQHAEFALYPEVHKDTDAFKEWSADTPQLHVFP